MTAPRVIAVGYDGSPDADLALRWAAGLAAALGAELRIVHALGLLEHAGLVDGVASYEESARRVAGAAGADVVHVDWRVVDGDPCAVLRRQATGDHPAELLVVGTRGAGGHPGVLLGSTSLELAERAPVPVVIVPTAGE